MTDEIKLYDKESILVAGSGIDISKSHNDIIFTNRGVRTLNDLSGDISIIAGSGIRIEKSKPDLTIVNSGVLDIIGEGINVSKKDGVVKLSIPSGSNLPNVYTSEETPKIKLLLERMERLESIVSDLEKRLQYIESENQKGQGKISKLVKGQI